MKELVQSINDALLIRLREVGVARRSQNARLDPFRMWLGLREKPL